MIFKLLELMIWFMISWIFAFIIHELCHKLSCGRQGGKGKIELWFYKLKGIPIPSMRCWCEAGSGQSINWNEFYYSGGIGAGIISTIVSLPFYWIYKPLFIGLFILGVVNTFYGLYEGLFMQKLKRNIFMNYNYLVEAFGVLVGVLLLRSEIWSWINV